MKKFLLVIKVLALSQLAFSCYAMAGNGWRYLGGASDVDDCRSYAGSLGYKWYWFGDGRDDQGVYYPYYNACFGRNDTHSTVHYDVYARPEADLRACSENIAWEVSGLRCRVAPQAKFIQCISEQGNKKTQIENVRCVERAYVSNR